MAAPIVNSDEELYQLTGSWEAAAALRDAQYNALNQYNASQPAPTTGGLLSGNILAGASWNSLNPTLAAELTAATGQETSNYAVGGATTADTLNQLNTYLAGGGQFDSNATVFLQTGGVDFLQGVDKATIKDNINQICKKLASQGVDVVLTGSPYAASINDVVTNNFDPKVDPLFNEIAKENKNVALVGTQGEILQNKALLIDALHTNAEGTSIYNQSVIDAMSQFKNEVPLNTPEDIAQVQETNTVVAPPPVITQVAASNSITDYQGKTYDKTTLLNLAKELAPSIDANRLKGGVYSTNGESIGFNYDESTKALGYAPSAAEQVVLDMARHLMNEGVTSASQIDATDTNRRFGSTFSGQGGTIYEIKRDADGNLVTSTWGKTTSDKGNIIAAASIAAAFMGIPADIGTAVLGQGASNLAVNTIGGSIFGAGTSALAGGDIVKGALLGGAGGALGSYLNTAGGAVLGDASDIAMTMADAGSSLTEIETALKTKGFSADVVADSLKDAANVLAPKAINIPSTVSGLTDAVNVVGQSATPSLSSVLNAIAAPVAVSTPVTDTVRVETARTPEAVDQATLNLINSQIAANVTKPTNIANVAVTGNRPTTTQEIVNAITASLPTVTTPTTIANQTITGQKPATVQEIVNAITATIPTVSPVQAQTVAEQVITNNRPVTIQEVINAITASIPSVIAPDAPKLTITADRPSSITDVITAATIPLTPTAVTSTSTTTTPTKETDPIKIAQLALATAGLLGAGSVISDGTTQYPIVPVPETFLTPTKPAVAPFTPLTPINFGDGNLLRGTQWEKFLDPNYGKVPEPIKYSQPSSLSYNDLMGILGSRQGMPPSSSLSINDIISGIQNQYGQTPVSTVGQKSA